MNYIKAIISNIKNVDNLNIVEFKYKDQILEMMSLELSPKVVIGKEVILNIKPTHIAIAKEFQGQISISNKIKATIKELENGKLLSSLKAKVGDTILESIITSSSSKELELKKGDTITLLIQTSDLSISEVLDD